jgi:hypothetical protein
MGEAQAKKGGKKKKKKGDIPKYRRALVNLGGFVFGGQFDTPRSQAAA